MADSKDAADKIGLAIQNNQAFLKSTPTAAQSAAQVKALTRMVNALLRLAHGQTDEVDD